MERARGGGLIWLSWLDYTFKAPRRPPSFTPGFNSMAGSCQLLLHIACFLCFGAPPTAEISLSLLHWMFKGTTKHWSYITAMNLFNKGFFFSLLMAGCRSERPGFFPSYLASLLYDSARPRYTLVVFIFLSFFYSFLLMCDIAAHLRVIYLNNVKIPLKDGHSNRKVTHLQVHRQQNNSVLDTLSKKKEKALYNTLPRE